jgi:dTDP-4-amino-4,6-dideoxygalactose transaminase
MSIHIAQPLLNQDEINAITRVVKSGMIACGPETKLFEEEFAEFVGARFACAVNNGTAALSLALFACGIGPGDEVITTPMTFVATANAILSCGATPVFADIDEKTFNLCPKSTEAAITEKTKAIMPVHLYGLPADMDAFRKIADDHGLHLIGDAAQAHGASIGDRKVGTLADVECFSFYPTKNMTTGEGGMATTNDEDLYNRLNSIRNHGRPDSQLGIYEHDRFGLNLRLTDIGSAIGRVQLRKLPGFNSARARNATFFKDSLKDVSKITLPKETEGMVHAWHQFTIRTDSRANLASYLKGKDIETRIYYPRLIQDYPHLEQYRADCPVAERIVKEVISLPVHPGLNNDDIEAISNAIISYFNE